MIEINARTIWEKLNKGDIVIVESQSAEDTAALGALLGQAASPGQIYTLTGDLGVGKTVFTQGFAEGLHVEGGELTVLWSREDGRVYMTGPAETVYDGEILI